MKMSKNVLAVREPHIARSREIRGERKTCSMTTWAITSYLFNYDPIDGIIRGGCDGYIVIGIVDVLYISTLKHNKQIW